MKFLCEKCKAKYQIPDEKIAGRTLRMKCRKCDFLIVIREDRPAAEQSQSGGAQSVGATGSGNVRGAQMPRRRRSAPNMQAVGAQGRFAPGAAAGGAGPGAGGRQGPVKQGPAQQGTAQQGTAQRGASGSALGAGFRQQVSTAAAPEPRKPPAALWHVAINDVPVGPIEREELARKIGTGAVTEDSLVWREGFDDWRPLGEVAELGTLIQQRRLRAPPPTPSLSPGVRASQTASYTSRDRPAAVAPIGGRYGAAPGAGGAEGRPSSSYPPASYADPGYDNAEFAATTVEPLPAAVRAARGASSSSYVPAGPESYEAPRRQRRAALPLGAVIAMVGAGAFGIALALIVAAKLFTEPTKTAAATTEETKQEPAQRQAEPAAGFEFEEAEVNPEEFEDEQETEETPSPRRRNGKTRSKATANSAPSEPSGRKLSAAERAMLERFGQSGGAAPSKIRVADSNASGGRNRSPLDGAKLMRVVSKNRPSLQRCYDVAIRGQSDPPSARIDVRISVGASGTVTRVNARGKDFGGLGRCLERAVRRWRFPASSEGGETQFPVVFSPMG